MGKETIKRNETPCWRNIAERSTSVLIKVTQVLQGLEHSNFWKGKNGFEGGLHNRGIS